MTDLIKVNHDYENDRITTSARTLWEGLERPYTEFIKWFDTYKGYGFIEGEDYRALRVKIRTSQGNEMEVQDYEITIDMAKQLCMLQKTEIGATYRKYFLDLEKKWNSPEYVMKRALEMSNQRILLLEAENKTQKTTIELLQGQLISIADRTLFNAIVRRVAKSSGLYSETYHTVYEILYTRCNMDVRRRAKNRNAKHIVDTIEPNDWKKVIPVLTAWYLQNGGDMEYLQELVSGKMKGVV